VHQPTLPIIVLGSGARDSLNHCLGTQSTTRRTGNARCGSQNIRQCYCCDSNSAGASPEDATPESIPIPLYHPNLGLQRYTPIASYSPPMSILPTVRVAPILLELHRSVRFCRVSHASRLVYKSVDRRLCIDTGFCTVFFDTNVVGVYTALAWRDKAWYARRGERQVEN